MILVGNYPPFINSAARLYSQLAESLSEMGHNVTVITQHPGKSDRIDKGHSYFKTKSATMSYNGVTILRVSTLSFLKRVPGGKALRFYLSCLLFAFKGVFAKRPDVILVYSPPLYMGISGYIISLFKRTRFVFNMQDIHPKVLFDHGYINHPILKWLMLQMEDTCYRAAHSFIVYSAGNKNYLLQKGIEKKISLIPNWIDINSTIPSSKIDLSSTSKKNDQKFALSYIGSMEESQGLELIVEAAGLVKNENIVFHLAGDGPVKPILASMIREKKLHNIFLHPVQLHDHYAQFIESADVCLLPLSKQAPLPTVPGKLPEFMVYGKPILAIINLEGDAAALIKEADCGICVTPGDLKNFLQAVQTLYEDKELRDRLGRQGCLFAEQKLSRTVCVRQYENVLLEASMS